jgi:hypothetical protein
MSETVLIHDREEWFEFIEAVKEGNVNEEDSFFVEHDLVADFCLYAAKRASIRAFWFGVVSTLIFVVLLGYTVKLLS